MNQRFVFTTNRNFPGRMGDKTAQIYLAFTSTHSSFRLTGIKSIRKGKPVKPDKNNSAIDADATLRERNSAIRN